MSQYNWQPTLHRRPHAQKPPTTKAWAPKTDRGSHLARRGLPSYSRRLTPGDVHPVRIVRGLLPLSRRHGPYTANALCHAQGWYAQCCTDEQYPLDLRLLLSLCCTLPTERTYRRCDVYAQGHGHRGQTVP